MNAILEEQVKLEKGANLQKSIDEVQRLIDQLKDARQKIQADQASAPVTMAKLNSSVKVGFEKMNDNLKEINKVHSKFSKAVNSKFKDVPHAIDIENNLPDQTELINRAIMMHLSREGAFDVVSAFAEETHKLGASARSNAANISSPDEAAKLVSESVSDTTADPTALKDQFANMYTIIEELRRNRNLEPAVDWARQRAELLEARGSNLLYELCRLQYVKLFTSTAPGEGPSAAIQYARQTFHQFPSRYMTQTQQLGGALAFASHMGTSPYQRMFAGPDSEAMSYAAAQFTSEFCALLSLSSTSPLQLAVTAGCIALPKLMKWMQIRSTVHVSWTSANELPIDLDLPREKFKFHSIFVCPVSKEQGTDDNPPVMLLCGHVLCKDSMNNASRGAKFKCPYCPTESHPSEAKELFL